jgi:antitoxin component of RelBE/YafQ-DinJ toxin-antitoxin module
MGRIKSVRIGITLREDIYKKVKATCNQLGIKPSTWISMVVTTEINKVRITLEKGASTPKR